MYPNCASYILFVCLVYVVKTRGQNVPTCRRFNDISSRTVLADVVFQGRMTSLPVRFNRSVSDPTPLAGDVDGATTLIAGFNVERVLKGQLSAGDIRVVFESKTADQCPLVTSLSRMEANDVADLSDDVLDDTADGYVEAVVGMKYLIFLNTSKSASNRAAGGAPGGATSLTSSSSGVVQWALGSFEFHKLTAQAAVLAMACEDCGQTPQIRAMPRTIRVREGQKLLLKCRASGRPKPMFGWFRDAQDLSQRAQMSTNIQFNRRGNMLQVKRVTANDAGVYWCQASNVLGTVTGAVSTVIVASAPGSARDHDNLCSDQDYCLNGGACHFLPSLGQRFCRCTSQFEGPRCQNNKIDRGNINQGGVAIGSIGIVIFAVVILLAVLLAIVITCIGFQRSLTRGPRSVNMNGRAATVGADFRAANGLHNEQHEPHHEQEPLCSSSSSKSPD